MSDVTGDKIRDQRAVDEALEAARFGDASDEQQMTLRDEVLALRNQVAASERERERLRKRLLAETSDRLGTNSDEVRRR